MSRPAGRGASSQAGTGFETEGAGHVRGGSLRAAVAGTGAADGTVARGDRDAFGPDRDHGAGRGARSEEHTSELQSQSNLVCRLLLAKKKNRTHDMSSLTS